MYMSMVALKVTDTYQQHQAIWGLFPDRPDAKRDHLFRVEKKSASGESLAIVQSEHAPQSHEGAQVLQSKSFEPALCQGTHYQFKLLANPTKCVKESQKRVEIKDKDEQAQWLKRKFEGADVHISSMESVFVKNKKSFNSCFVCFEGMLHVHEPEKIERLLKKGVGRQKYAGAGLLSLARA